MVRTVISLPESDKRWLDERAAEEGIPMTELIRRAVTKLREDETQAAAPRFDELLDAARGTWSHGDGLSWQQVLRGAWDDRAA